MMMMTKKRPYLSDNIQKSWKTRPQTLWCPDDIGQHFFSDIQQHFEKLTKQPSKWCRSDAEEMPIFFAWIKPILAHFHDFNINFGENGGKSTFFFRFARFQLFQRVKQQNQHFSGVCLTEFRCFWPNNQDSDSFIMGISSASVQLFWASLYIQVLPAGITLVSDQNRVWGLDFFKGNMTFFNVF